MSIYLKKFVQTGSISSLRIFGWKENILAESVREEAIRDDFFKTGRLVNKVPELVIGDDNAAIHGGCPNDKPVVVRIHFLSFNRSGRSVRDEIVQFL